jgi:4-hydroxyacetophenone monooxygenase
MPLRCASPSVESISEDYDVIRDHLASGHTPTLLAVLVHLTGDTNILSSKIRPRDVRPFGTEQGNIDDADRAIVADRVAAALCEYRDRGSHLPEPLEPDVIRCLMDFLGDAPLPDDYAELFAEEMGFSDFETRGLSWTNGSMPSQARDFTVAIIGGGISGILAAVRLAQAGIDYILIEKNDAVGGTWYENQYPGCRADTQNDLYVYSFDLGYRWPHYFASQKEMFEYLDGVVDRFGIREKIVFGTEIEEAKWSEATASWTLRGNGPNGDIEFEANVMISAVGQLNRPKLPEIEGRDSFQGDAFHSARWPAGTDLAGKRVALIGSGATAYQIGPQLASHVASLTIFQRSAVWGVPTPHYLNPVPPAVRWLQDKVPFYANWYRFWLRLTLMDRLSALFEVDPDWPNPHISVSAANDDLRKTLTEYWEKQLAGNDALLKKVVPDFPVGGRRLLRDCGQWAHMLQQDNVELVTEKIARIIPSGIATNDGLSREFDAIVYATGFQASHMLAPMSVVGRDGTAIESQWDGDDPRAYLGSVVPNFPNMFILYGPNTNSPMGGSIIFVAECQVRYVMSCIRHLVENQLGTMECRQDVHDHFNCEVDSANRKRVWGMSTVDSWVKNSKGRVSQNWPFALKEFWRKTRELDPHDFHWAGEVPRESEWETIPTSARPIH